MRPITVFCPVTRYEYMDRWFDDLASTDLRPDMTNLAFIIDVEHEEGGAKIRARIMDEMNKTKFRQFLIIQNEHRVNEVNIPIRRRRIAEIHEQSKDLIRALDGEFVLGLEDDTVFTNLCVKRLIDPLNDPTIGMVSAYEAGRWHRKIIGIWQFDDALDPKECWTALPDKDKDYEHIDAAGFYCYVTRVEDYLQHTYTSEVWQPWGPDVNFGLWLRREGYCNLVDWSQPCGHRDTDIIITPNSDLFSEHFIKTAPNEWAGRKQTI